MTKIIKLYWFSGTGNSLYIAKKTKIFLDSLGYLCTLNSIEHQIEKEITTGCTIGLVVPVAMQGTFPIVWEFVNGLPVANGEEIFLIDTLGVYSGGIKGPIKKIVISKGYSPIGAIEIKMPNFFLKKSVNMNDKNIVEDAEAKLSKFCNNLVIGKTHWNDIPLYSDLLSEIFKTQEKGMKWVKKFKKTITDKCINCGICVQLCPRYCIDMNSKHINTDSDNCILCQRCLEYCPTNAIVVNNKRFIKNGIISFGDMKKMIKE